MRYSILISRALTLAAAAAAALRDLVPISMIFDFWVVVVVFMSWSFGYFLSHRHRVPVCLPSQTRSGHSYYCHAIWQLTWTIRQHWTANSRSSPARQRVSWLVNQPQIIRIAWEKEKDSSAYEIFVIFRCYFNSFGSLVAWLVFLSQLLLEKKSEEETKTQK